MSMKEARFLKENVEIENEVSDENLMEYEKYMHTKMFPPKEPE